jgi:hypothetical protein
MEGNKDKGPNAGAKGIDAIGTLHENWQAERAARIKAQAEFPTRTNPPRGVQPGAHPRWNPRPDAVGAFLKANQVTGDQTIHLPIPEGDNVKVKVKVEKKREGMSDGNT